MSLAPIAQPVGILSLNLKVGSLSPALASLRVLFLGLRALLPGWGGSGSGVAGLLCGCLGQREEGTTVCASVRLRADKFVCV